jgi:PHD/YefM family antitoxin component YafN of YafNO toxin-antitoxin module
MTVVCASFRKHSKIQPLRENKKGVCMRTIEVTATPTVVVSEIEQASLAQGPTVLERGGQPLAILLPMSEYQMFRQAPQTSAGPSLRNGETATTVAHSNRSPLAHTYPAKSGSPTRKTAPPEFLREVEAFEKLKATLLSQEEYRGRAVAIHQGQVVAVGDDKMEVLAQAWEEFGEVPIYVEWVEPETPRRVRIPSVRVVRR